LGGYTLQLFFSPINSGLVSAIDVASYQQNNVVQLISSLSPDLVIVRMYLGPGYEHPSQQISKDQVKAAKDYGCDVGAYFWGYASYDPVDSFYRAMDLAIECGVPFDKYPMWLDVEKYTDGSMPNEAWLRKLENQWIGIYSGEYYWNSLGSPSFPNWYLWSANYNGVADLKVPSYGNMKLIGHQYTDKPCDRSVFSKL